MKIHKISAYGHQLTRWGLLNAYLVRESDGYTLIDTTLGGAAEAILAAARVCGVAEIHRVLLTHAHGDHVGSADGLAHLLGKVDLAIGRREARLLPKPPAQDRSLDSGEPQCKIKGSLPGINAAPTHLLADGELYGSLRSVATPGHTPGHFSFLDERDGTLYAGDALVTVGGKVHVPGFGPWYFPLPGLATWHRPTALASARRMAELPIRCYAAGHGRLIDGDATLLQRAVKAAEGKLK